MTTTTTARPETVTAGQPTRRRPYALYSAFMGIAALAVVLQGLWAGIFLQHDGQRAASESWINAHARGADVAILFAVLATGVAFVKLRERRELWIGGAVLVVLLFVESYLGGQIRDAHKDSYTVIHVPLAMIMMGLVVWLPLRAAKARRG